MKTHNNIVVTLMHDKQHLTNDLISDLTLHENENIDAMIVVDNGSYPKVSPNAWVGRSNFPVVIERIDENIGFTLGANYGLLEASKLSDYSLIFLISNDVHIRSPFIKKAEEILLSKKALLGNRHINWDTGWNGFNGEVFDYLEGYFLAMTNRGWKDVSYFDVNYAPCDMEDVDLSTKAKMYGYKLVSLNNPNIVHLGAGTYGYTPEREAITKRNKIYFREKWVLE